MRALTTALICLASYWPEEAITSGQWTPPAVVKAK
jgi:hypothetical protein